MNENIFPIDALPCIIKNAINEVQMNTKAPIPLIAMSALGTISLVCQQQIDVIRYNNIVGPVSLFLLTLAESGERKSTVDKFFMKPVYQIEAELNKKNKSDLDVYAQEKEIFNLKKKSLTKNIQVTFNSGKDTSNLEYQLRELNRSEPKEPVKYQFCFNDATPAALKNYLGKAWNAIGIMSDEAGIVFDGHALNELGFINKMWDGSPFSISRKSTPEQHIENARMTLSLMVQPTIFNEFLLKKGNKVKDIGFLARCLVCHPTSTQGNRQIENTTVFSEHLTTFHKRVREILEKNIENYNQGINTKRSLKFSPEAEKRWIQHYNSIEHNLNEPDVLYHHKEFGSKISENMARIAALIHFFSNHDDLISLDSLESAFKIVDWFYREQIRLFPYNDNISESAHDANILFKWIENYFNKNKVTSLSRNFIRQYGPNKLRNSNKLNIALDILQNNLKIMLIKENKTTYIYIFWNWPSNLPIDITKAIGNKSNPEYVSVMDKIAMLHKGKPDLTQS